MLFSDRKVYVPVFAAVLIGVCFYLGNILYLYLIISEYESIDTAKIKEFYPLLNNFGQKEFYLNTGKEKIIVKKEDAKNWIEFYIRNYSGKEDKRISDTAIEEYLKSLAPHFEIKPISAKMKYGNNRAEVFIPHVNGKNLNIRQTNANIVSAILTKQSSASISIEEIEPEITLEKINNLGINKLIGRGESDYGKSPTSRIHNIKTGLAKFNGIIIKPGEEFSFNNILGEVDEKSGYRAELVIKGGQLVREYGGGICQVSTTVFRAAILSGLPITERKPHSFPVQYYNPQGFDSTIYPGIIDLKFINDTPNHLLIQTRLSGSRLIVEMYGTDDGRKVELEGPIQYDKRSNGATKAYFVRKIYKDGQAADEKRFDSSYRPPPPSPLEKNPLE